MAVVAGMKKTNDHAETTKVNAKKKKESRLCYKAWNTNYKLYWCYGSKNHPINDSLNNLDGIFKPIPKLYQTSELMPILKGLNKPYTRSWNSLKLYFSCQYVLLKWNLLLLLNFWTELAAC